MWGWVVCPEGLNGGLEALLFNFEELPHWNAATADEPTQYPPLIEVDLSGIEPEATNTTLVPPLFLAIKHLCDITMPFNLHLQGALEQLQQTSPTTSPTISQHGMPGRKPPSAALGVLPSTRAEDPVSWKGTDTAIPDLMATSSQAFPCAVTQKNIPSIIQVSHSPSPSTVPKTPEMASISPTPQSQAPPGPIQPTCQMRCLDCKEGSLGVAAHD